MTRTILTSEAVRLVVGTCQEKMAALPLSVNLANCHSTQSSTQRLRPEGRLSTGGSRRVVYLLGIDRERQTPLVSMLWYPQKSTPNQRNKLVPAHVMHNEVEKAPCTIRNW